MMNERHVLSKVFLGALIFMAAAGQALAGDEAPADAVYKDTRAAKHLSH